MPPTEESMHATFLRLRGRVQPDGTLKLRPGYEVTHRRSISSRGPWSMVAEVRNKGGALLSRTPVAVRTYCGDGSRDGPSTSLAIFTEVPLVEGAERIEIIRLDPSGREPVFLSSIRLAESAPALRLLDPPHGRVSGRRRLRWSADGKPPPVQYRVRYSVDDGRNWRAMAWPTSDRHVDVDFDQLPGGERCRIAVLATNGTRSSEAISDSFSVAEKPCQAMIQEPRPDWQFAAGEVAFIGNGWWLETMTPELEALRWMSDRQGELGRGRVLQVALVPGRHRITLHAGVGARAGETSIEITVG